jgi:hypothetical protein
VLNEKRPDRKVEAQRYLFQGLDANCRRFYTPLAEVSSDCCKFLRESLSKNTCDWNRRFTIIFSPQYK